jgi:hypothetical protein
MFIELMLSLTLSGEVQLNNVELFSQVIKDEMGCSAFNEEFILLIEASPKLRKATIRRLYQSRRYNFKKLNRIVKSARELGLI